MKYLFFVALLSPVHAKADQWSYYERRSLSADAMQYFGVTSDHDQGEKERGFTIEAPRLQGRLNLTGDCGNLDIKASFKSIYSEVNRLFTDLRAAAIGSAKSIGQAAPMLALCYFSPTGCSIAKNLQLYASYSAKLRFDQCQAINRFTDKRASIYHEEQSNCVRSRMAATGDLTEAVEGCKSKADQVASWLDGQTHSGGSSNDLVKSSAEWAGLNAKDTNLMQALLGGIEYQVHGQSRIHYGGYHPLTPGLLFDYYTKAAYRKLCLPGGTLSKFRSGKDPELEDSEYFYSQGKQLINRRLLEALARLPFGEQEAACDRLASAMSLTKFVDEMEDKFNKLYVMAQNPYLPESERERLEGKTKKLVDFTMAVVKVKNLRQETLNNVRSQILSRAGVASEHDAARVEKLGAAKQNVDTSFNQCDDFTVCGGAHVRRR